MFNLPISTEVNKFFSKNEIYNTFKFENKNKKIIDENISYIYLRNIISSGTIPSIVTNKELLTKNRERYGAINSISFWLLELKVQNIDLKALYLLFTNINQTMFFVLKHNEILKVAAYFNKKIYISDIMADDFCIVIKGNTFEKIYENIFIDIFNISLKNDNDLKSQLIQNEKMEKINAELNSLQNKLKCECQFNKKVAINMEINKLKKMLEEDD